LYYEKVFWVNLAVCLGVPFHSSSVNSSSLPKYVAGLVQDTLPKPEKLCRISPHSLLIYHTLVGEHHLNFGALPPRIQATRSCMVTDTIRLKYPPTLSMLAGVTTRGSHYGLLSLSIGITAAVEQRGENGLNEQRIQQVLEIENQAQAIHEAAIRDAEQLQKQAEQETQTIIEKARAEAQEEAQRLASDRQASDERARILAESEDKSRQLEALAAQHFDRAVDYVLDRLIGREQS
jgi:V/A-type H+-transporting ATPase subunit G/H